MMISNFIYVHKLFMCNNICKTLFHTGAFEKQTNCQKTAEFELKDVEIYPAVYSKSLIALRTVEFDPD